MLEKSRQARQSLLLRKPSSPIEPYDELAMFGGRTGLVLPKGTASDTTAAVTTYAPAPIDSNPFHLPTIPSLLPGAFTPSTQQFPSTLGDLQELYFMDDEEFSTSDTWEGLYREVPEPSYRYGAGVTVPNIGLGVTGPANPPGEAMLEDRWSTFMHQYALNGGDHRH